MPAPSNFPGVYVEEVPSGVHEIHGVPTSVAAFIGWAVKGNRKATTRVQSWADFEGGFGGLDPRSLLGYAVSHFFANGGSDAYVVLLGKPKKPLVPKTAAFGSALIACLPQLAGIELFNLLCVPGETSAPIVLALQEVCKDRRAFLIVDCDEGGTVESVTASLPTLTGEAAMNAALYFPWIVALDPAQQNQKRAFPPSGFVAGIYARTDSTRGVWKAPAGSEATVNGATSLNVSLGDEKNGVLNSLGVNCLLTLPGGGTVVWGARTLHGNNARASNWRYVPVRRLALFIEESVERGTMWAVFEPNEESLWAKLRLNIGAFLNQLFLAGAFVGTTPRDAYFIKCDQESNRSDEVNRGLVTVVIGFAPLKPAEFVVLKLRQRAGEVRA